MRPVVVREHLVIQDGVRHLPQRREAKKKVNFFLLQKKTPKGQPQFPLGTLHLQPSASQFLMTRQFIT